MVRRAGSPEHRLSGVITRILGYGESTCIVTDSCPGSGDLFTSSLARRNLGNRPLIDVSLRQILRGCSQITHNGNEHLDTSSDPQPDLQSPHLQTDELWSGQMRPGLTEVPHQTVFGQACQLFLDISQVAVISRQWNIS